MAAQRLTWKEIQKKYPDQWEGLVEIVWQDDSNIESATVKYTDESKVELLILQIRDEIFSHVSNVAESNTLISKKYGLDCDKCVIAGLLHDISAIIKPEHML